MIIAILPVLLREKVNFRSQILERPSIGEYWNNSGVPVLPENVIFMLSRMCWCYSEAYNTGTQKWSSIVQYSCTSIWDLKYTFSLLRIVNEQYLTSFIILRENCTAVILDLGRVTVADLQY